MTHIPETHSSNYASAAISFSGETINLEVFDETSDLLKHNQIGAIVEPEQDINTGIHARAAQAVEWFSQSHPNFQIVSLGRNVFVFDMDTIHELWVSIKLHSWTMDDGSTINVIGTLPDTFTTAA